MTKSRGIRARRGTRTEWVKEQQGKHECACGCGQAIEVRAEHFNIGVPRYVLGHNARGTSRKQAAPCACGCDGLTTPGRRYISGHNLKGRPVSAETRARISAANSGSKSHRFGKRPPNYKGGRALNKAGYVLVRSPDHPFAHGGSGPYVFEHRLVMEAHLRAQDPAHPFLIEVDGVPRLRREIQVHHLDGDKQNNSIENLEALTASDHSKLHRPAGSGRLGR